MSRAGKFIPGGGGANKAAGDTTKAGRTGPIRAPVPGAPPEPSSGGKRSSLPKGSSLIKPVAKGQRLPIIIMSSLVWLSALWIGLLFRLPARSPQSHGGRASKRNRLCKREMDAQKAAEQKALEDEKNQHATLRATLTVDSKPTGAAVTIGNSHQQTPFTFKDLRARNRDRFDPGRRL